MIFRTGTFYESKNICLDLKPITMVQNLNRNRYASDECPVRAGTIGSERRLTATKLKRKHP